MHALVQDMNAPLDLIKQGRENLESASTDHEARVTCRPYCMFDHNSRVQSSRGLNLKFGSLFNRKMDQVEGLLTQIRETINDYKEILKTVKKHVL